jgi:hypothetical protein
MRKELFGNVDDTTNLSHRCVRDHLYVPSNGEEFL